jgi:TrmH family RNA methyltransferase
MGAVFAVPLARQAEVADLPGVKIALVPGEGEPLREAGTLFPEGWDQTSTLRARDGVTLIIGAEREGLPADVIAKADHIAHIPIETDSLNAAMAATIALYELQSRMAPR